MPKPKIDLTLIKRLMGELEAHVNTMESIKTDVPSNQTELVVEASKAAGLAAGVMQEAGALMVDIHVFVEGTSAASSKSEFLDKLLGSIKGPGNTN
jgi:hypothetical protein